MYSIFTFIRIILLKIIFYSRLSAKTGFLLWELMPSIVDTVSNVTDVRKHLLHNSLKTGVKATPIEQTRQIKSLEEASNRLEEKSSKFERDCEQLELEIKQQGEFFQTLLKYIQFL